MKRRDFLKALGLGAGAIAAKSIVPDLSTSNFSDRIPNLYELACPNCSGRLIIADVNLFECEYCGSLFKESTQEVIFEQVEEDEPEPYWYNPYPYRNDYFYDGGISIRTTVPRYTDWSSTPGVLSADPDPTRKA